MLYTRTRRTRHARRTARAPSTWSPGCPDRRRREATHARSVRGRRARARRADRGGGGRRRGARAPTGTRCLGAVCHSSPRRETVSGPPAASPRTAMTRLLLPTVRSASTARRGIAARRRRTAHSPSARGARSLRLAPSAPHEAPRRARALCGAAQTPLGSTCRAWRRGGGACRGRRAQRTSGRRARPPGGAAPASRPSAPRTSSMGRAARAAGRAHRARRRGRSPRPQRRRPSQRFDAR